MADLTNTTRWLSYAPDLLGNRELKAPFYFEVCASLSKEQMSSLRAALDQPAHTLEPLPDDATPEAVAARDEEIRAALVTRTAAVLAPYFKFGTEPLTVDGKRIETLQQYLEFVTTKLTGLEAFLELSRALNAFNTLSGNGSFFYGRFSGGFISTTSQSNGKAGSRTAAR